VRIVFMMYSPLTERHYRKIPTKSPTHSGRKISLIIQPAFCAMRFKWLKVSQAPATIPTVPNGTTAIWQMILSPDSRF